MKRRSEANPAACATSLIGNTDDSIGWFVDPTILEDKASWYSNVGIDLSGWMYTNPSNHFLYFYGSAYLGNGLYTYSRGARPFRSSTQILTRFTFFEASSWTAFRIWSSVVTSYAMPA